MTVLKLSRIALAGFILLYAGTFAVTAICGALGVGGDGVIIGAYVVAIYAIPGIALAAAACLITQFLAMFSHKNKRTSNG